MLLVSFIVYSATPACVPKVGVEPTRAISAQQILSLSCIPFHHLGNVSLVTDLNRRPTDYKSVALPTELTRHLVKQKMGAWTSAFTIGVSNRSCTALSTVKSTLFQSTLISKQLPTIFQGHHPSHALVEPAAGSYSVLSTGFEPVLHP